MLKKASLLQKRSQMAYCNFNKLLHSKNIPYYVPEFPVS